METRPGYVPVESLETHEQERLHALEIRADEILSLREEIIRLLKQNGRILRNPEEKSSHAHLRDLYEYCQSATDDADRKARLEACIDWERLDQAADKHTHLPKAQRELQKKAYRFTMVRRLSNLLERYGALREKGGDWNVPLPEAAQVAEQKQAERFYAMRAREMRGAEITYRDLIKQLQENEDMRDLIASDPTIGFDPHDFDALDDERRALLACMDASLESPEGYLSAKKQQLREMKKVFDSRGEIVETPYVRSKIDRILSLTKRHRPVFIHGELGTGKTALARHLSIHRLSTPHVERWMQGNPPPPAKDKEARAAWESECKLQQEPIVYSGHKASDTTEIVAARAIRMKDALLPEDQMREINARVEENLRRTLEEATEGGADENELNAIERKWKRVDRPVLTQMLMESYRSPVETKVVLGPLLRAMKEGRPFILDEMNAIPHHVLIAMNDLLLRRPGEMVTPPYPEAEAFKVEEGFCVIATGNYKPEDGLMYIGRQRMDAAYLSRFGIVSYDYLPQSKEFAHIPADASPERERELRAGNELYQMLVVRLLDDNLSATLPENAFAQLESLSFVARMLQDIFSEQTSGDGVKFLSERGEEVSPKNILKENVLSLRHLIPILEQWKKDGFKRPLDDYLFLEYIERSDARPIEKFNLYRMLKIQGNFFHGTGWPGTDFSEQKTVSAMTVEKKMYRYTREGVREAVADRDVRLVYFGVKQVVERMYGSVPVRTEVPEHYLNPPQSEKEATAEPPTEEEESMEDRLMRESLLAQIFGLVGDVNERAEEDVFTRS
jgi:MoxR-like ATPase